MAKPLSARHRRFVSEYLTDLNASAAYKRAGYVAEGSSADTSAARLFRNVQIKSAIEAAMKKRADEAEISARYVLESIKRVAETAEAKNRLSDALRGYELLGKHCKLFIDRTELTGRDGAPIVVTTLDVSRLSDSALAEILAAKNGAG